VELLAEDAAALIRHVFPGKNRRVHLFGWSLGGAMAFYLSLEHSHLLASTSVLGMSSCVGPVETPNISTAPNEITTPLGCGLRFNPVNWLLSQRLVGRLLGQELMGQVAVLALGMQVTSPWLDLYCLPCPPVAKNLHLRGRCGVCAGK